MTKFETIGTALQLSAISAENADERFAYSCEICCNRGLCIECRTCAIEGAHRVVLAAFEAASGKVSNSGGKEVSAV